MPLTHLLYLHGFRSSPLSTKAQKMAMLMRDFYPQVQWWCPQLPPSPDEAMQLLCDGIEAWQQGRYMSFPFQAKNLEQVYGKQRLSLIPSR